MRNHNNFYQNLKFSSDGERYVSNLLLKKLKIGTLQYNNNKDYDLFCELLSGEQQGSKITVEVKEDERAKETGNVVIEYESRGKPSGIATSKADFWVLRIHQQDGIHHYMYRTKIIKEMIRNKLYFDDRQMLHTDSNNRLYFFKVDVLKTNADMILGG